MIFVYKCLVIFYTSLGIFSIIKEVWEELRKDKPFLDRINILKKNSLIENTLYNNEPYYFINIFFDLYYFIFKLKTGKKKIAMIAFLTFIITYSFRLYPLLFLSVWSVSILKNTLTVLITVLKKKNIKILLFDKIKINHFGSIKNLFWLNIKLINLWSWALIYYILAVKDKKISIKGFENFLISKILQTPFWFICIIIKISIITIECATDLNLKRKVWYIRPKIAFSNFKENLFSLTSEHYLHLHNLLYNRKIIISKSEITLNPSQLQKALETVFSNPPKNIIYTPYIVWLKGVPHQYFYRNKEAGFTMTSSSFVKLNNVLYPTNQLSVEHPKQKYFVSQLDLKNKELWVKRGWLESFFNNKQMSDYQNFVGLNIRLDLLYKYSTTTQRIIQHGESEAEIIVYKNEDVLINIYDPSAKYVRIGKKTYLITELKQITNKELTEKAFNANSIHIESWNIFLKNNHNKFTKEQILDK